MTPEQKRRKLVLMQMLGGGAPDDRQAMRDRIAAAKAGTLQVSPDSAARAAEADQVAQDQMTLASAGRGAGVIAKAAQGLPFAGEWIDEGLNALDPGRGDRLREIQGAMDRQAPGAALASEIGGGIVGSIPLAIGAIGAAGKAATTAGKVTGGLIGGGIAGASEGALSGAGRANDGDRGKGAAHGAVIGGTLGAALGALAPLAADGAAALARRVKKLDVRTISQEFGLSAPAARRVKSALMNDDLDAATARLARIGDDAMLADSGMATAQQLDDALATGGSALRIGRERIAARTEQAGTRLTQTLDNVLGTADGVKAAARDISQGSAARRTAAYDTAYSKPIDYSGPGRKIEDVLSRIPARTLNAAIQDANEAMQAKGLRNLQVLADIAPDGTVTFREMPNVQQLDFIKRSLNDLAQTETDQFGRLTGAGIRANDLARELRDAIADAVPSYRTALRLGGDKIAEDNALRAGQKVFNPQVTVEEIREATRDMSEAARQAAKRGMREELDRVMGNARKTLDSIMSGAIVGDEAANMATEAYKAVSLLSSRNNITKARLVLGSGDAKALFDELDKTGAALALRTAVARNSATAIRLAGKEAGRAELQPGVVREFAGNILDPGQGFGFAQLPKRLLAIDPANMNETERAMMAEIADALTRIRGQDAERALDAVRRAMAGQPMKDAEAALIGRVVSGSLAGSAYQSGTQSLERTTPR